MSKEQKFLMENSSSKTLSKDLNKIHFSYPNIRVTRSKENILSLDEDLNESRPTMNVSLDTPKGEKACIRPAKRVSFNNQSSILYFDNTKATNTLNNSFLVNEYVAAQSDALQIQETSKDTNLINCSLNNNELKAVVILEKLPQNLIHNKQKGNFHINNVSESIDFSVNYSQDFTGEELSPHVTLSKSNKPQKSGSPATISKILSQDISEKSVNKCNVSELRVLLDRLPDDLVDLHFRYLNITKDLEERNSEKNFNDGVNIVRSEVNLKKKCRKKSCNRKASKKKKNINLPEKVNNQVLQHLDTNSDDVSPLGVAEIALSIERNELEMNMIQNKNFENCGKKSVQDTLFNDSQDFTLKEIDCDNQLNILKNKIPVVSITKIDLKIPVIDASDTLDYILPKNNNSFSEEVNESPRFSSVLSVNSASKCSSDSTNVAASINYSPHEHHQVSGKSQFPVVSIKEIKLETSIVDEGHTSESLDKILPKEENHSFCEEVNRSPSLSSVLCENNSPKCSSDSTNVTALINYSPQKLHQVSAEHTPDFHIFHKYLCVHLEKLDVCNKVSVYQSSMQSTSSKKKKRKPQSKKRNLNNCDMQNLFKPRTGPENSPSTNFICKSNLDSFAVPLKKLKNKTQSNKKNMSSSNISKSTHGMSNFKTGHVSKNSSLNYKKSVDMICSNFSSISISKETKKESKKLKKSQKLFANKDGKSLLSKSQKKKISEEFASINLESNNADELKAHLGRISAILKSKKTKKISVNKNKKRLVCENNAKQMQCFHVQHQPKINTQPGLNGNTGKDNTPLSAINYVKPSTSKAANNLPQNNNLSHKMNSGSLSNNFSFDLHSNRKALYGNNYVESLAFTRADQFAPNKNLSESSGIVLNTSNEEDLPLSHFSKRKRFNESHKLQASISSNTEQALVADSQLSQKKRLKQHGNLNKNKRKIPMDKAQGLQNSELFSLSNKRSCSFTENGDEMIYNKKVMKKFLQEKQNEVYKLLLKYLSQQMKTKLKEKKKKNDRIKNKMTMQGKNSELLPFTLNIKVDPENDINTISELRSRDSNASVKNPNCVSKETSLSRQNAIACVPGVSSLPQVSQGPNVIMESKRRKKKKNGMIKDKMTMQRENSELLPLTLDIKVEPDDDISIISELHSIDSNASTKNHNCVSKETSLSSKNAAAFVPAVCSIPQVSQSQNVNMKTKIPKKLVNNQLGFLTKNRKLKFYNKCLAVEKLFSKSKLNKEEKKQLRKLFKDFKKISLI